MPSEYKKYIRPCIIPGGVSEMSDLVGRRAHGRRSSRLSILPKGQMYVFGHQHHLAAQIHFCGLLRHESLPSPSGCRSWCRLRGVVDVHPMVFPSSSSALGGWCLSHLVRQTVCCVVLSASCGVGLCVVLCALRVRRVAGCSALCSRFLRCFHGVGLHGYRYADFHCVGLRDVAFHLISPRWLEQM